jgi:hypothetical protein
MKCKLCGHTVEGEYHPRQRAGLCIECFDKPFPITSVCRADLEDCCTPEQIAQLDDGDMAYLARKMADAYMQVFWDDLEIIVEHILKDKAKPEPTR